MTNQLIVVHEDNQMRLYRDIHLQFSGVTVKIEVYYLSYQGKLGFDHVTYMYNQSTIT